MTSDIFLQTYFIVGTAISVVAGVITLRDYIRTKSTPKEAPRKLWIPPGFESDTFKQRPYVALGYLYFQIAILAITFVQMTSRIELSTGTGWAVLYFTFQAPAFGIFALVQALRRRRWGLYLFAGFEGGMSAHIIMSTVYPRAEIKLWIPLLILVAWGYQVALLLGMARTYRDYFRDTQP